MLKKVLKFKSIVAIVLIIASFISLIQYPTRIKADDIITIDGYNIGERVCLYDVDGYRIHFCVYNSWDHGYNATIEVENQSDYDLSTWKIRLKTTDYISNIWNAKILEQTSDEYIIGNDEWNGYLKIGTSVSLGYTASDSFSVLPDITFERRDIAEFSTDNYIIEYKLNSDWENGFSSEIYIKNISQRNIEGWELSFTFDREITDIWNSTIIEHNGDRYKLKDAGYNSHIAPGQYVEIGFNGSNGTLDDIPCDYYLSSYTLDDWSFNDSNGNYVELPDGRIDKEYLIRAILPNLALQSEVGDEVRLSDDYDNDGLTLSQEYEYDTNPFKNDTDEDGLFDYDEIFVFRTNPLKKDTDYDGMSDGTEVSSNLNPLLPDSDFNGISDSKEVVEQKIEFNLLDNSYTKSLGTIPKIFINGKGDYSYKISAEPILNNNIIKNLGCIVGTAFDFKHEDLLQFENSVLSFEISDEILNEHEIDDLCIAYYETDTNTLIPLETSTTSYNTISSTVDHYSIFLVIDTKKYLSDIDYMKSGYVMDSGKVDVVFVIDTTASMRRMISEVRDNIVDFVDELAENNVDARLGLVEYRDIYEDGVSTTQNHGWFENASSFKKALNRLYVNGGGDIPESAVDGLFCAANMKYRTGVHRHLILITDADWKKGTAKNADANLEDARNELYGRNITVHAYVPRGYGEAYRDLFDTDSSRLCYRENGFEKVKESIVDEISEESNSGCWVRLSDGSVVFLEQDPELCDDTVDTDKDGIPDIYELGEKKYVEYSFRGYKIRLESWNYYTNPINFDTDGDSIWDGDDFYPTDYDAVIISKDADQIKFNSGRIWNILPCSTKDYIDACLYAKYRKIPVINWFYSMPDDLSIEIYNKAEAGVENNNLKNRGYSFEELCLITMMDPQGIPLYTDDMIGVVSSDERRSIIEKILNRPMKYYGHQGDGSWKELKEDDDKEGGFFRGTVLSEADINLTKKIYETVDLNSIMNQLIKALEVVSLVYFFATAATVVVENMAAFVGYVKLYGFSAGIHWYMQLGTSGFPDGAITWMLKNHDKSSSGNLQIIEGTYSDSEISAAEYMSKLGHSVVLRPPIGTRPDGGTSDLLVDGKNYDVYTPITNNPSAIIRAITKKNTQAIGIVLDLSKTTVKEVELGNVLARVKGAIEKSGSICNITDIVVMPK